MPSSEHNEDEMAMRLTLAMKRLRARLREESCVDYSKLSVSHLCILQCLGRNGPATAASLAAVEHVSQQAIAQNISSLRAAGLIQTAPDPSDGRKSLISLTESGQTLRESIIASRNAWLVHAIDSTIAADELSVLEKAIDLLERLAAARR